LVEAYDEAGNNIVDTLSFAILAFDKPQFTEYPSEINDEVNEIFGEKWQKTVEEAGGFFEGMSRVSAAEIFWNEVSKDNVAWWSMIMLLGLPLTVIDRMMIKRNRSWWKEGDAKKAIQEICAKLGEWANLIGKEKKRDTLRLPPEEILTQVRDLIGEELDKALRIGLKADRDASVNVLRERVLEKFFPEGRDAPYAKLDVLTAFK